VERKLVVNQAENRPSVALYVNDLAASLTFYTTILGFTTTRTDTTQDWAIVRDNDGDTMLLITSAVQDPKSLLTETHMIFHPGATLGFFSKDLVASREKWLSHGLDMHALQEITTPLGDPALMVRDPNGYMLRFVTPRQRTPEEIMALYAHGPQTLEEALTNLTPSDLDLVQETGEWTIRQLVHHIVDGDDLWVHAAKAALANSGCQYRHDWYTFDNASAVTLDYAGRAIEPALMLFQANHAHMLQLLGHLPDAMERSIIFAWPGQEPFKLTVENILLSQVIHVASHCEDIHHFRSAQQ